MAQILTDEVICRYGVPESLHSDQVANFVSEVIRSRCTNLSINRTQTSANHPEGNGQVERFNRTLEGMLSKEIEEHQKDWDDHLQKVLFAYRTAVHTTGYTPYFIMSGRSPNLPIDILLGRAQTQGQELPDYVKKTSHLSSQHFLWFANDYMRLTEDKNKRRIKSPVERLFKLVIVFGFLFLRSKRDKPRNSLLCGGVNTQLLTKWAQ